MRLSARVVAHTLPGPISSAAVRRRLSGPERVFCHGDAATRKGGSRCLEHHLVPTQVYRLEKYVPVVFSFCGFAQSRRFVLPARHLRLPATTDDVDS